jgi:two-component system, LytTR family, response regulator
MIKAIIIEDEEPARLKIGRMLEQHKDFIKVIGSSDSGAKAITMINEHKPDLLFLDIHLLDMNGFDVLTSINVPCPYVIFTTAYDNYALKAFEVFSVEYLLKPIDQPKFDAAIDKLKALIQKSISSSFTADEITKLSKEYSDQNKKYSLPVHQGQAIILLDLDNISHFEADDKYVFAHCLDGKKYLTQKTLTILEEFLPDNFLRIHRSSIINTQHIRAINKDFKSRYILSMNDAGNSRIQSSIQYKAVIKEVLMLK